MPSRRSSLLPILAALVVSSCSAGQANPPDPVPPTAPTSSTTAASVAAEPEGTADFLSALEARLDGTGYDDAVEDDREALIAAGTGACALLERGLTVDDLLVVLAVTLDLRPDAPVDDLVLAAALVGAATEHLCPGSVDG